jgi:hypothetical protein
MLFDLQLFKLSQHRTNRVLKRSSKSWLLLLSVSSAIISSNAKAIDTVAEGFRVNQGSSKTVDAHGVCRLVTNSSGYDHFISTKTSGEWSGFLGAIPSGVTAPACAVPSSTSVPTGFFFLSAAYAPHGNFGGLSGADSFCLNQMNSYSWPGKVAAGSLNSTTVKAFLCDNTTCGMAQAGKKYVFTTANETVTGGTYFIADSNGAGPGNQARWAQQEYFGRADKVWTGREAGGDADFWSSTPSANTCLNWSSSVVGNSGTNGDLSTTTTTRWSSATTTCNYNTLKLLCFVHPNGATSNTFTFVDQADLATSTLINSNIVQITGLSGSAPVSVQFGTSPAYRTCSDSSCSSVLTNWTSVANTISNNQYLQVRMTTSSQPGTTYQMHAFVGSESSTWSITTAGTKPVGYFVATAGTYNGSLGGRSGADGTCLTHLQAVDWMGKSSAGTLNSTRVKAFLCDSTGCSNLTGDVEYKFALAGDVTKGGSSIKASTTGGGPNDQSSWSGSTYFGSNFSIWTGRGGISGPVWGTTTGGGNCSNWASSSNAQSGNTGGTGWSNSMRWNEIGAFCDNTNRLICMVHP